APHGHRPRVCGRGGQAGRRRHRSPGGPAGQRRGPHHLRPLPQLPHRQHPVVQGHHRGGRGPGRRLRRVRVHPGGQRHHHRREPARGRGGLLRRLRQRHPHRPHVESGGGGRAHHRGRPHRHHRRRHLQVRRGPP